MVEVKANNVLVAVGDEAEYRNCQDFVARRFNCIIFVVAAGTASASRSHPILSNSQSVPNLTSNVVAKLLHTNVGAIIIGAPGDCQEAVAAIIFNMHVAETEGSG